jgi:hypothetical protein
MGRGAPCPAVIFACPNAKFQPNRADRLDAGGKSGNWPFILLKSLQNHRICHVPI